MSHITSLTVSHAGATYTARITGEAHNGSALTNWSRDGAPIHPRYVPQFLRDSVNDLARDFALSHFYR